MNIAFFNTSKSWGGGEKWHFETAYGLKLRGHKVTLFGYKNSELLHHAQNAGITSYGYRVTNLSFLNPVKVLALSWRFRRLNIEAVILNLSSDVKFAGIAAKIAGVKKIIYRRGLPVPIADHAMNRFLFRNILTHVIANTEYIKSKILQKNPALIDQSKISVIYNGINISNGIEKQARQFMSNDLHGVILGSAGRLSKEKRQAYLIDMANLLNGKNLDFSLIITGEGPMLETLTARTQKLNLENQVFFMGFTDNMKKFYNSIDIFILPSSWEGCSNAVLEAMQHGLPVVAFDNSSFRELINHGITGFLAQDNNIADLAEKVQMLITDVQLRQSFGIAARELVCVRFNQQKSLDLLENLLTQ